MHNCLSIAHVHHLASWEKVCYLVLPTGVCPCSRDHMPFTTGDVIMGAPYVVVGDHKRPFIYVVSRNRILLWLATGGGGLSCSYEKSRNQSYEPCLRSLCCDFIWRPSTVLYFMAHQCPSIFAWNLDITWCGDFGSIFRVWREMLLTSTWQKVTMQKINPWKFHTISAEDNWGAE